MGSPDLAASLRRADSGDLPLLRFTRPGVSVGDRTWQGERWRSLLWVGKYWRSTPATGKLARPRVPATPQTPRQAGCRMTKSFRRPKDLHRARAHQRRWGPPGGAQKIEESCGAIWRRQPALGFGCSVCLARQVLLGRIVAASFRTEIRAYARAFPSAQCGLRRHHKG